MSQKITIDLSEESLAELLINHATDWIEVLAFLENVALSQGKFLAYDSVAAIIRAEHEKE